MYIDSYSLPYFINYNIIYTRTMIPSYTHIYTFTLSVHVYVSYPRRPLPHTCNNSNFIGVSSMNDVLIIILRERCMCLVWARYYYCWCEEKRAAPVFFFFTEFSPTQHNFFELTLPRVAATVSTAEFSAVLFRFGVIVVAILPAAL